MKTFLHLKPAFLLAGLFIFGSSLQLAAHCTVNKKHTKINSDYYSSIALKKNGAYATVAQGIRRTSDPLNNSHTASDSISYSINGTAANYTSTINFTSNPLAASWGSIFAYRVNHIVKVLWNTTQEINVSHFDVERSFDGREWEIAIPFIPGNNLGAAHAYAEVDPDYLTDRLYYRIKQTDKNGRTTYSPVCVVSSDNGIEKIVVYPVPVQSAFHIDNIDPKKILKIEMITLSGSIVRTWFSAQDTYDISGFAKGLYIVKVTTIYDNNIFSKLTKQ